MCYLFFVLLVLGFCTILFIHARFQVSIIYIYIYCRFSSVNAFSSLNMEFEVTYQESLLDLNEAARGYERKCVEARRRIMELLNSTESDEYGLLSQLPPVDHPTNLEDISPPRLKELPPLYCMPSTGTAEADHYPSELSQAVERIVSIRLEIYHLSSNGQAKSSKLLPSGLRITFPFTKGANITNIY